MNDSGEKKSFLAKGYEKRNVKSVLAQGYEKRNGKNNVFDKVVAKKKNLNLIFFFNWIKQIRIIATEFVDTLFLKNNYLVDIICITNIKLNYRQLKKIKKKLII